MKDKNIIIFYGGLILLQYIVKFLKKIIKQDRPIKQKTYGMPSTKSATLFGANVLMSSSDMVATGVGVS